MPSTHTTDTRHTCPAQPSQEPTDEQLMAGIKRREEDALVVLYRRHTDLLRTIAGRVVNNDHDVDDLIQEIFLEVWERAEYYNQAKGMALGWLVILARRRSIDKLRKKLAYGRAEDRLREETEGASRHATPHQAVSNEVADAEMSAVFNRVMKTLPAAQREALRLSFYCGLSQRQIAAQTGIPLGTIKTRIELAIRRMRLAVMALGGRAEWCLNKA